MTNDDSTPNEVTTDPEEMDVLYRIYRRGFMESGEGWNGEMYYSNPEAYERRMQARFEALKEDGEFETTQNEELRALVEKWRNAFPSDEALEEWYSAQDVQIRECADELEAVIENNNP